MRYIGGVLSATPPTVTGPVAGEGGSASGIWSLETQSQYEGASGWPKPGVIRELYVWGNNYQGALGTGNSTTYSTPVQVGARTWGPSLTAGACNCYHTMAVYNTGGLYAWGYNSAGQLGQGNTTSYSSPVQIGALTTWASVSVNNSFSAAIKSDGTLWMWGENARGQLGQGNLTSYSSPVQVGTDTNWAYVSCGGAGAVGATYAITTDGKLYSWGENSFGELGLGDTTDRLLPVQVGALTNWSSIVGTFYSALARKTDGTLWSWGRNNVGQSGQGNLTAYSSPVQIGGDTDWADIAAGDNFHAAIKTNGTSWAWGQNTYGKLGVGDTTTRSSPTQVGALTNWQSVTGSGGNTYWIKTDNTMWAVGRGTGGELGNGASLSDISSPVQVGGASNWLFVVGGANSARAFQGPF